MQPTVHIVRPSLSPAASAAPKRSLAWQLSWAGLLILLAASWKGADMRPFELWRDSGNMATYAAEFFPPNFTQWRMYLQEMVVTLQIALWGTALAVVTAVPLALLASANIVPWWIYQPMRRLMDSCRAINEMVFAMLFVVAVGLGPFAGVLALWVHTTGVLAKLFAEAVEAIDPQPVLGNHRAVLTASRGFVEHMADHDVFAALDEHGVGDTLECCGGNRPHREAQHHQQRDYVTHETSGTREMRVIVRDVSCKALCITMSR